MTSTAGKRTAAISTWAKAELARRQLLDFCQRLDRQYKTPAHVRASAALLEDVEAGRRSRVIVLEPPRHGKSRLLQLFTAWYLGRNPERNVVTCSHGQELADRNSRLSRACLEDDRWPFATKLSAESSAVHRWNTRDGGGLFAVGAGGGITGRGADVLILDDLQHDAGSDTERESTWRWYAEVAVPRLEPGAAVVVIATRWHEDDLVGRMLAAEDGAEWKLLSLPAIATANDPIGRPMGAPLWPERFGAVELESRRVAMGSRAFEAQFNQNPLPATGNLFQRAWLHGYETLPAMRHTVLALDAASKVSSKNDYSVLLTAGTDGVRYFVIDVVRGRWEFPQLRDQLLSAYSHHRPNAIIIEDASAGVGLAQELQQETNLPIIPVPARGSKISRAEGVAPLFEAGKVAVPQPALGLPWLEEFETELLRFPNGKHDDQVDAVVLALTRLRELATTSIDPVCVSVNPAPRRQSMWG
jgi:predicted phage terminase large subunit-like protein